MWSFTRISKHLVFNIPLLDKSAGHRAHDAQEEAEKQHDIDANSDTWGSTAIGGDEILVYFDDE